MAGDIVEVWASGTTLLSFDGRVLEVFGVSEVQRFHIGLRPVVTVGKKLVTIYPKAGGQFAFFYDKERAQAITDFADHVHAAHV